MTDGGNPSKSGQTRLANDVNKIAMETLKSHEPNQNCKNNLGNDG